MLDRANDDNSVKAIVMYLDGPGGSTSAISPFVDFATRKKKPVVALVDDAYSLHYWTAVAVADHIMAENTINSGVGSVGVYVSFMDVRGYYKEKGITLHEIYSDHSEHKNEAFRLALEGKYEKIKTEMLNPLAVKFQEAVRAGRPNLKEEPGVLTGKTFYAEEALELGMIDSIGSLQRAFHLASALAEIKNY
jgi:protease-4